MTRNFQARVAERLLELINQKAKDKDRSVQRTYNKTVNQ
jgi:hypothetical protein